MGTCCPLTGKMSDGLFTCTDPHLPDDIFICEACPAFDPIIHDLFPETRLVSVDESVIEDKIDEIEGELS